MCMWGIRGGAIRSMGRCWRDVWCGVGDSRDTHERGLQQRVGAVYGSQDFSTGAEREYVFAVPDGGVAAGGHGGVDARASRAEGGGDVRWYQLNAVSPPNPQGSFAFTSDGHEYAECGGSDDDWRQCDCELSAGQVDTFSNRSADKQDQAADHIQEYYVQDDWRVNDRLTLNLGARWSLHSPSTEKNNQGAVFNLRHSCWTMPG